MPDEQKLAVQTSQALTHAMSKKQRKKQSLQDTERSVAKFLQPRLPLQTKLPLVVFETDQQNQQPFL